MGYFTKTNPPPSKAEKAETKADYVEIPLPEEPGPAAPGPAPAAPVLDDRASIAAWLRNYTNTHPSEMAELRAFRMRLADEIEAKWDLKGK